MNRSVILIGAQGSGKSTQQEIFVKRGYQEVVMSRILLAAQKKDPTYAETVALYASRGQLVPNEYTLPKLEAYMQAIPHGIPLVFDGPARNIVQLINLEGLLRERNSTRLYVHLKVSRSLALERMQQRVQKMLQEGKEPRQDDMDPEAVNKRLDIFYSEIDPILEYIHQNGIPHIEIDAELPVDQVTTTVLKAMHKPQLLNHQSHIRELALV